MMSHTFHVMTFGCQMNVNDSEWLERALMQRGMQPAPLEEADVVVLNTCSVRDKPEQKVYSALGRVRQATGGKKSVLVAVAGCVAQQIGQGFFERFPQVRLVLGTDGIAQAPEAIERLLAQPKLKLSLIDFSARYPERDAALPQSTCPPSAFVNIMQGCNNYCTYCIVPFTRGRQKSRYTQAILEECRSLVAGGSREITLLGQNVNSFGQDDCGDGTSFESLLRAVAGIQGLQRLRFVSPHPKDISPSVIRAFGELENLCPRLHLPLQAGSDRVLKTMNRKYDGQRFLQICADLRAARPDMALSTDLIVGFPGETEDDFQETLRLMREANFVASFSFAYSDRPGTRASLYPDKIDPEVKQDRLVRLQALQDELGAAWLQSRVGTESTLLLESTSRKNTDAQGLEQWQGRDTHGNTVNVELAAGMGKKGLLLPVHIQAAKKHSLLGIATGEAW
ncbi:MAG: tRNA (N6-isopentenyl adenosine(37)-C2)-methylthiotransferase MiaB [Desulfovibrionaceae bacterium]|nr:tRNA (N6-isopentenyl adenosine(37)-C2)-methylthiotransferase MiaB [Desulfovibrionaceae bacterium]